MSWLETYIFVWFGLSIGSTLTMVTLEIGERHTWETFRYSDAEKHISRPNFTATQPMSILKWHLVGWAFVLAAVRYLVSFL